MAGGNSLLVIDFVYSPAKPLPILDTYDHGKGNLALCSQEMFLCTNFCMQFLFLSQASQITILKLLQRSHFNVVHQALQKHVSNVHISAINVCVIQRHGLF